MQKRGNFYIVIYIKREEKVTYSSVAAVNRATAKKYTPAHYIKLNEHKRKKKNCS